MNFFHVRMWFTMMFLFTYSVWSSIKYVRTGDLKYDDFAIEFAMNMMF